LGDDALRVLSPLTTLLPHGLFAPRRTHPFGLDNAAASLAKTICPNAQTYVERPMVLPRDAGAQQQAAELPDFSQVRGLRRLGPGRYTVTSLRQRLAEEGRGCFYAVEPDPDSESDSYDPTRECFNIDREVETLDETQDTVAGSRVPVAREDPRTPGNNGQVDPPPQEDKAAQLAQLRELHAKLDEDHERLTQLERALEQDRPYPRGRGARGRTQEVHRQIVGDGEPEQPASRFPRAGQNVVIATMLLRNMPEPSNSQARHIRDEVQTLLQVAAAQQAESSASRRRGAASGKHVEQARNEKEVSVHQQSPPRGRKTTPVQDHLVDNQRRHDAQHDINEYRRCRHKDAEERGNSAHRGGRYDSDEDRMAPEPPGPRVFSRAICSTPLPSPFRPPTSIAKYNGVTKPKLWLADFRLACQLGGARGDDRAIIRQLPLFLSDTTRRWLEELPANQIHDWTDLVRVFEGNFKETYIRPGNSWDLSKCKQKSGETLREYARRFSKQRTELPHIPDHDVIMAFVSGTTCRDVVRELGRNRPQTIDELMDVVANYAAREEAVGAFFSHEGSKGKAPADDDEGPSRGPKKSKKKKKARPFKRETLDDDFVAAVERKKPRGPPEGAIFDKMLKEPCPYHKGGANHKLEDCRMLKKYFNGLGLKKDDQKKEKSDDKGDNKEDEGFPVVHDCYMIYGGPSTQLTVRQRKRERREVFAARMAVP